MCIALSCVLANGTARASGTAVLVVDLARDGDMLPIQVADALRGAFLRLGVPVLDGPGTRRGIEARTNRSGADLHTYRQRLKEADDALAASSPEQSLAVLEALIADLAVDPDFSADKQALLESARLKLALRLIGLAGKGETGKAETPFGKRARALLVDALRVNPALVPSRSEYPPRFFTSMEAARTELLNLGTGGLRVESRPAGADVYVEGRHFGQTPLVLGDAVLSRGAYRIWVEADGARSLPRLVRVGETAPSVVVDLAFEASLWAEGPGLRPMTGADIDEELVRMVGQLLQVERLVLVGRWQYEERGDWLWSAVLSVENGALLRHGVVQLDAHATLGAGADALAAFLEGEPRSGVESRALPPVVVARPIASEALTLDARSAETEFPWVPVGIAVGSVTAVAAGVGIAFAVWASLPRDGAMVVSVRPMDEATP